MRRLTQENEGEMLMFQVKCSRFKESVTSPENGLALQCVVPFFKRGFPSADLPTHVSLSFCHSPLHLPFLVSLASSSLAFFRSHFSPRARLCSPLFCSFFICPPFKLGFLTIAYPGSILCHFNVEYKVYSAKLREINIEILTQTNQHF